MLKPLLNDSERIAHDRLSVICKSYSAQLYLKIRLADVLPIERSGLPNQLFQFALQSHYDFVITDPANIPLFAIEIDGPSHDDPKQIERDDKKEQLSRRFNLPLLRIYAEDLYETKSSVDLLSEVAEYWFLQNNFGPAKRNTEKQGTSSPRSVQRKIVIEKCLCPTCGSEMVEKVGEHGRFLSCSRGNECIAARDIPKPSTQISGETVTECPPIPHSLPHQMLMACLLFIGLASGYLGIIATRSNPVQVEDFKQARIIEGIDSATDRQKSLLEMLMRRRGWNWAEQTAEIKRVLGQDRRYNELTKKEASILITAWDDRPR